MPLVIEPKARAGQPINQPAKPEVSVGRQSPTTARAEALKARLMGTPNNNPAPPRIATTSARQEQYKGLQSYAPPPTQASQNNAQPMGDVAPPPSGLSPDAVQQTESLSQVDTSVGVKEEPTAATSQPLSPQFVALAKKEQAIRKARQELKSQQEAWERERANYVAKESLKTDPITALNELGLTYDKLTELQLSQQNPDPNQQTLEQLEKLKAQIEERLSSVDKRFEERDKQAYDAAVNQIRKDVELLVNSDPAFETIKASGETGSVVELIEKVFYKEGTILSVEEAAQLVEDALVEKETNRLEQLLKVSKIKSRMDQLGKTQAEQTEAPHTPQPTLSNTQSVNRPLSARERAIMRVNEINAAKLKK